MNRSIRHVVKRIPALVLLFAPPLAPRLASAQIADPEVEARVEFAAAEGRGGRDLLVRRAEDGTIRVPNPNGSNKGTTPGMAKNDYVLKTYPIRNAAAIDVQSYLLRALAYEGGAVEVMGRQDLRDADGKPLQFVFVTAPTFMIPGIDETIARIDVPGFAFHDGTGNSNRDGIAGCQSYVGKHRTAGELRSILIGTELGNVGQFYFDPFADPALNTIYFSENPADVADDLAALERFDLPPLQAEFGVTIYEVSDDDLLDVGVDFESFRRGLSGTIAIDEFDGDGESVSLDAILRLDAAVIVDFLNFLVRREKAELHTETKLLAINTEDNPGALSAGAKGLATAAPAVFRSVRYLPYSIVPPGAPAGGEHLVAVTDPGRFEGVEIEIQPFIAAQSITANVQVTVNGLVGYGEDGRTPDVVSRSTRSVVNLRHGERYLLGSFAKRSMVDVESGIPLLMDIPWLGRLFRRDRQVARDDRLIVFVSPRIVDSGASPRNDRDDPLSSMRVR